jgi:dTDP-4-dehydrorhamnose reductase
MRLLIAGGKGMLGRAVETAAHSRGWEVSALGHDELDVSDPLSVAEAFARDSRWDAVLNCAAYTQVDRAETEPQAAYEANVLGPGYLGRAALQAGAQFLHVSTDFVFDGQKTEPYQEDDPPNPLGVYGETKLAGEEAALAAHPQGIVVRTSWLFGDQGKCFPRSILDAFRAGKPLRVVADQTGCPTYCPDLALTLLALLEKRPFPGIYHAGGPDPMTWHAFAQAVANEFASQEGVQPPHIEPIRTADWPTPARRPAYSVLGDTKLRALCIPPMRPIQEAIREFVRAYRAGL